MTSLARALTALALALTGLVLAVPTPAFACRCQVADTERQVARADAVFVGTVDDVARVEGGRSFEYAVTARRSYKGGVQHEVVVTSRAASSACGLGALQVGTDYLFLVTGAGEPYRTTTCSGSGPAAPRRVQQVEKVTGPGVAIAAPAPETATRTRVEDSEPGSLGRLAAPGGAIALVGLLGLVVVRRLARR